ncbi:MAG TPA: hypothetical protein VGE34_00510 [Candidatus Saccharimonadales bacterium]
MDILLGCLVGVIVLFGFVVFFGAPYVPSRQKHLEYAFDKLYRLSGKDLLLDLGSGDGKVLREAARRGARAVGFELNPLLVFIANLLSKDKRKAVSHVANIWTKPFPAETTVVYIFGDSRDIEKLEKRISHEAARLERKLYVMSYGFKLPNHTAKKHLAAYYLYEIKPLQPR